MIKVDKKYNEIPEDLKIEKHKKRFYNLLEKKNKHSFSGYNTTEVKQRLYEIYSGKCAFCETKRPIRELEIEHYRPKKAVTESPEHKGYYWLAFEWSNLLLACKSCNNYKLNHFPIEGNRIFLPDFSIEKENNLSKECSILNEKFVSEKPLILNPECDQPEDHIYFDFTGEALPKNGSIKAKATIEICRLNNEILHLDTRKKRIDSFFESVKNQTIHCLKLLQSIKQFTKEIKLQCYKIAFFDLFKNLKAASKKTEEYSQMYSCLFNNFKDFFEMNKSTHTLSQTQKRLVLEAFNYFLNI